MRKRRNACRIDCSALLTCLLLAYLSRYIFIPDMPIGTLMFPGSLALNLCSEGKLSLMPRPLVK